MMIWKASTDLHFIVTSSLPFSNKVEQLDGCVKIDRVTWRSKWYSLHSWIYILLSLSDNQPLILIDRILSFRPTLIPRSLNPWQFDSNLQQLGFFFTVSTSGSVNATFLIVTSRDFTTTLYNLSGARDSLRHFSSESIITFSFYFIFSSRGYGRDWDT